MTKGQLRGRVAVITGAASGIGRASALLFAREGAAVVMADVNESAGLQVAHQIAKDGGRCAFITADVTRAVECERVINRTIGDFGRLDILFNNAGIIRRASVVELTEADWDRVMAVNVKAIFLMSRLAIPVMEKNGEVPSSIQHRAGAWQEDHALRFTVLRRVRSCS